MHILGLPTDIFNVYPATIKFKTYQARWQIGDIYVSGDARKTEDNPQGLGCYLVMTGRGCDDIFRILDSRNSTFGDMFRRCERRYGLDNFHFTRLDIAIDDKNEKPFFTIEQIKKKCEKEEFISNSEGYHFDESKFDDFDTAKTVYIGAGKSGLSYRFYDKDKEVCSKHNKTLDEVGSWKRTEMQLRDDKAHAFAMTFKDRPLELGELAFGLLANNLRFVVPNRNESNKSRWKTCRFWERFLGAVEVLKLYIPKQHNSYNTINNHKRSLKASFYIAIQDDCVRKNPFDFKLSEVLENDTKEKVALTEEQEQALLSFIKTDNVYHKYYDDVLILLKTGLRISELCGLTIMDVDFIHEVVVIDHQLLKSKEQGYYIETPKTKSGTRQVPLSRETIQAFQRVMKKRPKAKPFVIDGRGNFLFVNHKGKPKVAIDYNMLFVRMVKKYNKHHKDNPLPHITPHTLRHTFCTRLASKNMNPKDLQYIMGHSNISITMNWYAHASIDTAKSEVQRLIA